MVREKVVGSAEEKKLTIRTKDDSQSNLTIDPKVPGTSSATAPLNVTAPASKVLYDPTLQFSSDEQFTLICGKARITVPAQVIFRALTRVILTEVLEFREEIESESDYVPDTMEEMIRNGGDVRIKLRDPGKWKVKE